jgi:hypothetical protein
MSHIFISYAKGDIEFARYLRLLLQRVGFQVWIDERGIEPSDDWWETIEKNIITCAALVVVMSPRSLDSRWVKRELLLAEDQQKPLFPVLLEGKVWSRLADIQAIDMSAGLRAPLPETFVGRLHNVIPIEIPTGIEFTIVEGNALTIEADVLALKYARGFHGVDGMVASGLIASGVPDDQLRPLPGEHNLIDSQGVYGVQQVLYVGAPGLNALKSYIGIRDLGANTLRALAQDAPATRHLATPIHGPGFGLDEVEALRYQLLGFTDAILEGTIPTALERITIVEIDPKRVERLQQALDWDFKDGRRSESEWGYIMKRPDSKLILSNTKKPKGKSRVIQPDIKPHAFVVMSDTPDSDDLFYYGIQGAVHAAGLLCERLDGNNITDDTLAQIKERIETAAVVIAEVSVHTPAVYLQVGYAWGKERPTILLAKEGEAPPFDVRCIFYNRIKELELGLAAQLKKHLSSSNSV